MEWKSVGMTWHSQYVENKKCSKPPTSHKIIRSKQNRWTVDILDIRQSFFSLERTWKSCGEGNQAVSPTNCPGHSKDCCEVEIKPTDVVLNDSWTLQVLNIKICQDILPGSLRKYLLHVPTWVYGSKSSPPPQKKKFLSSPWSEWLDQITIFEPTRAVSNTIYHSNTTIRL